MVWYVINLIYVKKWETYIVHEEGNNSSTCLYDLTHFCVVFNVYAIFTGICVMVENSYTHGML